MIVTVPVQALLSQGAGAQPASTIASEAYVLVGASVQTIDTTTGAQVGSSTTLSGNITGTALAEWYSDGSAPSQLIVIGTQGSNGEVWSSAQGPLHQVALSPVESGELPRSASLRTMR